MRTLVLCTIVGLAGCQAGAGTPAAPDLRVVQVAAVERASGAQLRLTGTVRADSETPLGFRVSGQVVRRLVRAGERVAAGQPLLELDARDLGQQQRASAARVASARAQAQATQREQARLEDLVRRQLVSAQMYDQAVTSARAAQEVLAAAQAELEVAQNALEYSTLRAPAAGVIVETHAEQGQVVTAGQVVAILAEDGPREAEVYVPEEAGPALADAGYAAGPGLRGEVRARLREVAGAADAQTRTWRARYRLELPAGQAGPGLGTTITLVLDRRAGDDALLRVPVGAVVERGTGAFVWRVRDGLVQPVAVELRRLDSESAYVAGPVSTGESVVAAGAHLLVAGERVRTRTL